MCSPILTVARSLLDAFPPRRNFVLENLALRHPIIVLNRGVAQRHSRHPRLREQCGKGPYALSTEKLPLLKPT